MTTSNDSARLATPDDVAPAREHHVIDLDVQGMTCASCAARIQKKLGKRSWQASVNYATEKAHVLTPRDVDADQVIQAIRDAGYDASLPDEDAPVVDRAAELKRRLIVCAILALPVIVMAMVPALQFPGWQWVSLVLTTPVMTWGAWGFHRSAWVNLRHGATTMDTLISLGTTAAFLWSVYAMIWGTAGQIGMRHEWGFSLSQHQQTGSIYFEAACGIIVFILAGRYIEARSRSDASSALRALADVQATTVTVLEDGQPIVKPIEALQVGDVFVVGPGETIPTDGEVLEGVSGVDNSIMTGESVPVDVAPGDHVVGAALNTSGRLVVRATAVGSDTRLAQIAQLVEQAQTGKSRTQGLADTISGVFVPVVIAIALLTFAAWAISGAEIAFAISAAVSVLIVSCPCALGLATPTALLAGSLRGSQLGILIRGPHALEQTRALSTVVMDKTGTITAGQMSVSDVACVDAASASQVLARAGALEDASTHPIARAIVDRAREAGAIQPAQEIQSLPGKGVSGVIDGERWVLGNESMMRDEGLEVPQSLLAHAETWTAQGASVAYLAGPLDVLGSVSEPATAAPDLPLADAPSPSSTSAAPASSRQVLGVIAVTDQVAPGAPEAIAELKDLGLTTVMATGDSERAARHIASVVGIDEVRAGVLPADKFEVVRDLQASGATVAMIGDGVNDAAALSQADVGISMGSGTDAAMAASDLTLMRHDLRLAVDAIRLSRRTLGTIRANLFWAFFYNIAAIPLAAMGMLTPMVAGAAMACSSVFVVTNSFRLRGYSPR